MLESTSAAAALSAASAAAPLASAALASAALAAFAEDVTPRASLVIPSL